LFYVPLAVFVLHLIRQVHLLRLDDPAVALRLFKSNRDAGLLLFAALFAGSWGAGRGWPAFG
jgi:4-hydroxybenzoate polyprenyltransferase